MLMAQNAVAERNLGHFQVVGVAAATTLATLLGGTIPAGVEVVEIFVSGQAVRWRGDGTAPTAAIGAPIAAGTSRVFTQASLANLRFIEQLASATLDIVCYGR